MSKFPLTNYVELQQNTPAGTPLQKLLWGAERKYGDEIQLEHFHTWFEKTHGVPVLDKHPDIALSLVRELYAADFQAHLQADACEVKTKYDGLGDYLLVTVDCAV